VKATVSPPDPDPIWQKTPYANLIRYKTSGTYFARVRIKGKLIRRTLKTKSLSVAKLRLADLEKAERQRAHSTASVEEGRMTFLDAMNVFEQRLENNLNPEPKSIINSAAKPC
jgi:hypothetical protein